MKKSTFSGLSIAAALIAVAAGLYSCSKTETVVVSAPYFAVGQTVSPGNISGSVKGTFKSDSIYYVTGDITINKGDTLVVQPGVKVYFKGNFSFIVRGNLLSLGTKDKPVFFTVQGLAKKDVQGQDPTTDPAYQGTWGGLLGDTTTQYMILKWTHVEFGCGTLATSPVPGIKNASPAYMISFVNPLGTFVLEDSWIYGGVDDPIRIQGGKIHVMRNTFEKSGFQGGECLNIKSGTVGNIAYNLFIGPATSGSKPSNNGGKNPQTEILTYNNTILNGGYRRAAAGRGGSINYEEGSKGLIYNNLMVNCKFGLRIVGTANYLGNALVVADTAHIKYGYNYNYGDSASVTNQFIPVNFLTKPQTTDIPNLTGVVKYSKDSVVTYDASSFVRQNNPLFVKYPLPQPSGNLSDIAYATGFDFHLQSGSPALGKGFTGFTPLTAVPVDANFGATEITAPGVDIGAYQSTGKGNQH